MHNRIAVIGIGYVGFPLLKALGTNDKNSVIGYDISKSRVGQVRHELVLAGKTNIVTTEIGDIQSANIYISLLSKLQLIRIISQIYHA